jgi:ribonucleotide reductase beta subunit family protein with ferritin-like domain
MNITPINLANKSAFTQLYQKSKDQYWLPQSVNLGTDNQQWPQLAPELKNAVLSMLQYAILLDSYQVSNIARFTTLVNDSELKALLSYHGMMEAIHAESYSYFAETVCTSNEKKDLYTLTPEGQARLDILSLIEQEFGNVVANYWLEAVAFQALFRLGDILRSQSLMPGLSSLVQLIARDEELHVKTFALMLTEVDVIDVRRAFEKYAPLEGLAVATATGVKEFQDYVPFIAQYRLGGLGFKFESPRVNPFKELYKLSDGSKRTLKGNFFTSSLVYDNARTDLDWNINNWF